MNSTTIALLVLVVVQSAMLGVLLRLYLHARQLHEQARRESAAAQPGSHQVPPADLEARQRWEALDLSRLHELNREEAEKLLAKMRGSGVKSLTSAERAFLDRMTQAVRP
jgi:hypothetical protein